MKQNMTQNKAKTARPDNTATVQIDLNNEVFQTQLFTLKNPIRHAALKVDSQRGETT
jgi:hypothetical protein